MSTSRPLLKWKNFTIGTFAVVIGKMFLRPRLGNKTVSLIQQLGIQLLLCECSSRKCVNLILACLLQSLGLVKEFSVINKHLRRLFWQSLHFLNTFMCEVQEWIKQLLPALQELTGSCACVQGCQFHQHQNRKLLSLDYEGPTQSLHRTLSNMKGEKPMRQSYESLKQMLLVMKTEVMIVKRRNQFHRTEVNCLTQALERNNNRQNREG